MCSIVVCSVGLVDVPIFILVVVVVGWDVDCVLEVKGGDGSWGYGAGIVVGGDGWMIGWDVGGDDVVDVGVVNC